MKKMRPAYTPAPVKRKWHELRRHTRFYCDVRLTVVCFRTDRRRFWGRASDICEQGLAATIVGELNVNEVVSVEMRLPLAQSLLSLRAAVRHRDGFCCGFEFLTLNETQRELLRRTCDGLALKERAHFETPSAEAEHENLLVASHVATGG